MKDWPIVHVVSWVYWSGNEQGGGGFWWYWEDDNALKSFDSEVAGWCDWPAYVRLVDVPVPNCNDQEITDYLDANLHLIEYARGWSLPARKVALTGVRA